MTVLAALVSCIGNTPGTATLMMTRPYMAFLQNDPSKAIDSLGSFPERCSSTAPDISNCKEKQIQQRHLDILYFWYSTSRRRVERMVPGSPSVHDDAFKPD